MNAEADRYISACTEESARLGSAAARLQALQKLRLKTAVKESHCSPVQHILYNAVDPRCCNLVASLGKNQATIYDDQHMGSYIGVAVHFTNEATEHTSGGGLQACAWLHANSWSQHQHGDACLAVAGVDPNISVISVTESRVIRLLEGHSREVVQLASAAAAPKLLASLSRDGELRTWNVAAGACTSASASQATSLAVHPGGDCIVTGGRRGALHRWHLPHSSSTAGEGGGSSGGGDGQAGAAGSDTSPSGTTAAVAGSGGVGGSNGDGVAAANSAGDSIGRGRTPPTLRDACEPLHLEGGGHSDTIDRMLFLSPERLATRSSDGRICIWDWRQQALVASWKVPHATAACGFNATPDGMFICTGNSRGAVFVYDAADGSHLTALVSDKIAAPVQACALSNDCRHLLAAAGKGFVFRYEQNPRHTSPQDGEKDKENSDANVYNDDAETALTSDMDHVLKSEHD